MRFHPARNVRAAIPPSWGTVALRMGLGVVILCAAMSLAGCKSREKKPTAFQKRYETLPAKNVPPVFAGTILEKSQIGGADPFLISGFGLVVNLENTGDGRAPAAVRDYIIKEMQRHYVGSELVPGQEGASPEAVLRDKRVSIVRVEGYLPPGARKGQTFDAYVSALPNTDTTSLARGDLYRTELRVNGGDFFNPGGSVNVLALAQGPVFINPVYALDGAASGSGEASLSGASASATTRPSSARSSLRSGVILDGAVVTEDRYMLLRLLDPQLSLSRRIEMRVDDRFQELAPDVVAAAQDEAIVHLYVPKDFRGDWEHFAQLVMHLYIDGSAENSARKAKELAEEAQKPGAPLLNISYAWEGIGKSALPFIQPLLTHATPEVAFAAARAGAFIGDESSREALAAIAHTTGHPFQINAVQVLGGLPNSPAINHVLRPLLDSPETLVRLEAYRMLARNRDPAVYSRTINEQFVLDIVPSKGRPIIYASRQGIPRIAVIGDGAMLDLPVTFTALGSRLSISSNESERRGAETVTIFFRDLPRSKSILSRPDMAELIARLGGEGAEGEPKLNFSYGDVVAVVSALAEHRKVSAVTEGKRVPALFVLQEAPGVQDAIRSAPQIPEQGRPQSDRPPPEQVGVLK